MSVQKGKLQCHCVDESNANYIPHIWTMQLGRWSQAPWVTWCQRQGGAAEGREGLRGRAAGASSRAPMAPESSQPGSVDIYPRGLLGICCCSLSLYYLSSLQLRSTPGENIITHACVHTYTHQKTSSHAKRLDYTPATATGKSKLNVSWLWWLLFPRQAQKKEWPLPSAVDSDILTCLIHHLFDNENSFQPAWWWQSTAFG